MFESFYKLKTDPFLMSPDHRFALAHENYDEARRHLLYGVIRGEGIVVITGHAGTGKSTLVEELLAKHTGQSLVIGRVLSTQLETVELLRMVAFAFGINPPATDKASVLIAIQQFVQSRYAKKSNVLLIVDEAQDLDKQGLEALRQLTNIKSNEDCKFQLFLLGQPALRDLIRQPEMEQFRQRIIAYCHLEALSLSTTHDYIHHRLKVAGWRGDPVITAGAIALIHKFSRGIPRRINMICGRLLLLGLADEKHQLDADDVREVMSQLTPEMVEHSILMEQEEESVTDRKLQSTLFEKQTVGDTLNNALAVHRFPEQRESALPLSQEEIAALQDLGNPTALNQETSPVSARQGSRRPSQFEEARRAHSGGEKVSPEAQHQDTVVPIEMKPSHTGWRWALGLVVAGALAVTAASFYWERNLFLEWQAALLGKVVNIRLDTVDAESLSAPPPLSSSQSSVAVVDKQPTEVPEPLEPAGLSALSAGQISADDQPVVALQGEADFDVQQRELPSELAQDEVISAGDEPEPEEQREFESSDANSEQPVSADRTSAADSAAEDTGGWLRDSGLVKVEGGMELSYSLELALQSYAATVERLDAGMLRVVPKGLSVDGEADFVGFSESIDGLGYILRNYDDVRMEVFVRQPVQSSGIAGDRQARSDFYADWMIKRLVMGSQIEAHKITKQIIASVGPATPPLEVWLLPDT